MDYFRLLWNLYQQKKNTKKSRQQIELLQKRKLEKMLRYAYEHSPYYRKAFEAAGIKAEMIGRCSVFSPLCRTNYAGHKYWEKIVDCEIGGTKND